MFFLLTMIPITLHYLSYQESILPLGLEISCTPRSHAQGFLFTVEPDGLQNLIILTSTCNDKFQSIFLSLSVNN